MAEGIATAAVGTIVTIFLQEAVNAFKNRKKKKEVTNSAHSIDDNINWVKAIVPWYERRHKDTSEPWRDRIAKWRGLVREIQECCDTYKINKIEDEDFATEMEKFKKESDEQSKNIAAHIQNNEKQRGAQLQVQPDSPDNHPDGNRVGIVERLKDIWALVRKNFPKQLQEAAGRYKVMKVISIVGSRGVGKTCLASQVYRHLPNSFPLRAFVSATGKDKEDVLKDVLLKLHPAGGSVKASRTYLCSANEWCFIVVDDVHDLALGCEVIDEFSKVTKVDCIIILTTTVQSFAQSWSGRNGHVYKMMPLSTEFSRRLFIKRITPAGSSQPADDVPEPEEFGVGCDDGVPLAVISWAEYRNYENAREKSGCKAVWSKFGDGDLGVRLLEMEQRLKQSYDSLADHNLQTCLLYFILFPPENSVRRGSLKRRWEADEEVRCNNSMGNWETLVDRNLLCPIQVSITDGAKTCRLSGAMHGYILSHMSWMQEGFGRVLCSGEDWPDHVVRRLSLHTDEAHILNDRNKVSRLRTLQVVAPENKKAAVSSSKKKKEPKAPDLSLDNCELLWVLDLEAYGGQFRVEQVSKKLKLLRYLSLRSVSRDYVGQQIGDLKDLETLDVGKEKVVRLHADVLLLPKLKHLLGKFQLVSNIPPGANENLVTLAGFMTIDGEEILSVIQRTKKLRKVKVFFDPKASAKSLSRRPYILWGEPSYPLADAITAFLDQDGNHDRSLSLDIPKKAPTNLLAFLENAEGKLHSLKLCGTSKFPEFKCQLEGIQKLCLSLDTLSWQDITEVVKGFPLLKYLKLVAKEGFVGVPDHTQAGNPKNVLLIKMDQNAQTQIMEDRFKNLERMSIQSAEADLPTIAIEDGALTNLVSLHLVSKNIGSPTKMMCNRSTPKKIPQLSNLKGVALRSSSPVGDDIKKEWHKAARDHPKSPQVLFIDNA